MTGAWVLSGAGAVLLSVMLAACGSEVKTTGGTGGTGAEGLGGFPDCEAGCVCAHSECVEGEALAPPCSQCATEVCEIDPYCCGADDGFWDLGCTSHAVNTAVCGCPPKQD